MQCSTDNNIEADAAKPIVEALSKSRSILADIKYSGHSA
jgi:hypothetical protein